MHALLKSHHNCDASFLDIQKEGKSKFLLRLNIGRKKLAACLLHNIDIAIVSERLSHLKAQYPVQCPDICIG